MKIKNNSAIALILSVGVLAVLALITIGFSAFTKMELLATENQINLLKASYIAQAGIARVIEDIKYDPGFGAMNEPYDSPFDPWYYPGNANYDGSSIDLAAAASPSYGGNISYAEGYYRLKVIDCGGLININCPLPNSDAENHLEAILDELGLSSTQAQNLMSFRQSLPGQIFTTKEEIKLVSGIGQADYESIKDFVTLWGDVDDGIIELDKSAGSPISSHTERSFVNVNTAPEQVLKAVFRPMMNNSGEADLLAQAVKARRSINPFDGLDPDADVDNFLSARGEFERFLYYAADSNGLDIISPANRNAVLKQSDPNSYHPLNNSNSTKSAIIGFDANGYYEIEAIGVYRGARKRINQVVSVFRKINQTSKNEFKLNAESAATCRISWKDTCPVDFTVLKRFNYEDDQADGQNLQDFIADSLKLGFWDNFEEDYDAGNQTPDALGILGPWKAFSETFTINASNDGKLCTWVNGAFIAGKDYFPEVGLDQTECIVDDFAVIVHSQDEHPVSNIKYPGFRPNLPWPAVPAQWAWIWAPLPDASNCPDIGTNLKDAEGNDVLDAGGNPIIIDSQYVLDHMRSRAIHQQYLNSFHLKFGGRFLATGQELMSAIYCNNKQFKDLLTNNIDAYQQWVNYDGTGYIYFTPSPDLSVTGWTNLVHQTCTKPFDVISKPNVMVSCNEWIWSGHPSDNGTKNFPFLGIDPAFHDERTFFLKAIGRWHTSGVVYFDDIESVPFTTTEQIMVYEDRYFKIAGMGNMPDVDYFRVVPGQGVYTSQMFSPAGITLDPVIEWGTIRAHVTLPGTADSVREPVYLVTSDSTIIIAPAPSYIPSQVTLPSGGPVVSTNSQSICYQAYLFSDFGETDINNTDFEQAPVIEDVTITYLPKTRIVYYNAK